MFGAVSGVFLSSLLLPIRFSKAHDPHTDGPSSPWLLTAHCPNSSPTLLFPRAPPTSSLISNPKG